MQATFWQCKQHKILHINLPDLYMTRRGQHTQPNHRIPPASFPPRSSAALTSNMVVQYFKTLFTAYLQCGESVSHKVLQYTSFILANDNIYGQIAKYILAYVQQTMGIDNQNSKKISKRDMLMLSYRLS